MRMLFFFLVSIFLVNKCADFQNGKPYEIVISYYSPKDSFWQVHHTRNGKKVLVEWLPRYPDVEKALEAYRKIKALKLHLDDQWLRSIHYLSDRQKNALDEIEPSIPWDNTFLSYLIMLYLLVEDPKDISDVKSLYSISDENRLILEKIFKDPEMLYALNRARDRNFGVKKGKVLGLDRPNTLVFFNNWSPWNESEV